MFYEVPITIYDNDLRGGIYANVVNGTINLQFTINPNFWLASTADETLGVYKSSTAQAGTLSNVTWTVYQEYLDQIPQGSNGPILPQLDLSTAYLLNNSSVSIPNVSQDIPIPYANFRDFQSTFVIYDDAGLNAGTDVNYWALQSANYTNIWKVDPYYAALLSREMIGDDWPSGMYYFDHRLQPISTIQFGNMQLVLNAATANSGAQVLVAWESLALINALTNAGSLYGN
jgi:hypothetical protein